MFWCLYRVTYPPTGEFYIGAHGSKIDPRVRDDGYRGSGKRIAELIELHGKKALKREILEIYDSEDDLADAEFNEVNKWLGLPLCLNMTVGGKIITTRQRQLQSESTKERFKAEGAREKTGEASKKVWARPGERERRSLKQKESWKDPERRKNVSIAQKESWKTPKRHENASITQKKRYENPKEREKASMRATINHKLINAQRQLDGGRQYIADYKAGKETNEKRYELALENKPKWEAIITECTKLLEELKKVTM